MNKTNYKTVQLSKGEMNIYNFGAVKLQAYKANDFLADEVFLLEKSGKLAVIEAPCFFDNIRELTDYIASLNVKVKGLLLSYHMAGASFLTGAPVYSTKNAYAYGHTGGGKALIESFKGAFGELFDPSVFTVTNIIESGEVTFAGIRMNIIRIDDAFEIEIPEINVVYTHMLGHDCHSIVAGDGQSDATIAELKGYIKSGYDLILTSHYTSENLKDAETKIAYLEDLKQIAAGCDSAEAFKAAVLAKCGNYAGENYLDMTSDFFFPNKWR